MSATDRQNRLLLAEDWKKVYQSFRNADFQSYDFDNLRRTMISYLRQNYPEDFNDYIESSEYLALIDLIAFLGQNLSFRIDLNARDNFLELAERRESVLRLARLLSYNPKRNLPANGLLKVTSIRTSENIVDSNGLGLAGQSIVWNDPTNTNWYEQFIKIFNAAQPVNNVFGKPIKNQRVNNIPSEQYKFNAVNTDLPKYSFRKSIQGTGHPFEIVSADIQDGNIIEDLPVIGNNFGIIYRNDGAGPSSVNTGFFVHLRQGTLDSGEFTITSPVANQVIDIDAQNINNTDVWLYKLDNRGRETEYWTKVDALEGNNIIYNSVNKNIRNLYSVLTRVDDRINLIFSDGVFGNLPKGRFRVYYRTSANKTMAIRPQDMLGVSIQIPYLSRNNTSETLSMTFELGYTISNASPTETNESIKQNAPSTYYTQNRLITAEDYNVGPLAVSQEIVKTKAVNRTASGISRYYDLLDATGKYSTTNLYGADGIVYKEYYDSTNQFTFNTQTDIEGAIVNTVEPILKNRKTLNYYYDKFPDILVTDLGASFEQATSDTNRSTGVLKDIDETNLSVGTFTANSLKYIENGTLCKFIAPEGQHFMANGTLMAGAPDHIGSKTYIWTKVVGVIGNGTEINETTGQGSIIFNDVIPTGAVLTQIVPKLANNLLDSVKTQIIDQAFNYNAFGLRYDITTRNWRLITESNLNISAPFSTGKTGDISNQQLDASWLLLFQTDGEKYTITSRGLRYVFESDEELKFFFDGAKKIFDNKTGKIVKDRITVLSINTKPDDVAPFTTPFDWEIVEEFRDKEGYVDSKKVQVGFFDSDDDGVVDDPEIFVEIVKELVNPNTKYIFQEKYLTSDGVEDFRYIKNTNNLIRIVESEVAIGAFSAYNNGQIFYITSQDIFKVLNSTTNSLTLTNNYKAFRGRDDLKFQYIHAADSTTRIDPSSSNIMDIFMLTKTYDTQFRLWINGALNSMPLPPSSDSIFRDYGSEINKIKSISDEIIYHPVKYKVLFGSKAETNLQATFKVVKNPNIVLDSNEIKSRIISAVNQYFTLDNWEFGETFYFSELSTYVMSQLAPDIVTLVIVPKTASSTFGSLYEIKAESDEIFISGATVSDVEIIDTITASRLNASGNVITSDSSAESNTTIQSSSSSASNSASSSSSSSSSSTGSSY